tara:strand:- start:63 stop:284 length:222 start_codon:yes stop_codon:yes gene_type:complete
MFNWDNMFKSNDNELKENIRNCIDLMYNITNEMEKISQNVIRVNTDHKLYTTGNTEALESIRNRLDQLESRKH